MCRIPDGHSLCMTKSDGEPRADYLFVPNTGNRGAYADGLASAQSTIRNLLYDARGT